MGLWLGDGIFRFGCRQRPGVEITDRHGQEDTQDSAEVGGVAKEVEPLQHFIDLLAFDRVGDLSLVERVLAGAW